MTHNLSLIVLVVFSVLAVVLCILKRGKKAFPYVLLPVSLAFADYLLLSDMPKLFYIFIAILLVNLILKRKRINYE